MSIAETFIANMLQSGDWKCKAGQRHYIDRWCEGYATGQGYDSEEFRGVLLANWNNVTRWNKDTKSHETLCRCMERIGDLAEKAGYALEWSDEWTECGGCYKAVRTQPDGHGWRPQYWIIEEDALYCRDCADPCEVAADCVGDARKALPEWITPQSVGYYPVTEDTEYENGWHPGQTDTPDDVSGKLEKAGVKRYVFVVGDIGQFDVRFGVCVRKRDLRRARAALGARVDGRESDLCFDCGHMRQWHHNSADGTYCQICPTAASWGSRYHAFRVKTYTEEKVKGTATCE